MKTIIRTIEFQLHSIHTLSDVARLCGCSIETVRKKFLNKMRIHFDTYLMLQRVRFMQEALIITLEPCKTICCTIGIREDYGARIFKNITGMTMTAYREKYQKQYRRSLHNSKTKFAPNFCEPPVYFYNHISNQSQNNLTTIAKTKQNKTKQNKTKQNTLYIR